MLSTWHQMRPEEALERLQVDPSRGLSPEEAARRLSEHGPNELEERGRKTAWRILWEQLSATLVVVLIGAALVSLALGDVKDAVAILAIVVLNAALGLIQELRSEKAMAALQRLAAPSVRVRRGGVLEILSARDLVPGDIVQLEAGSRAPADCRIIESVNLRMEEASLTGESVPVEKDSMALEEKDLPIADRRNMAYMGTTAVFGRGQAAVVATGMSTELGAVAEMVQEVERERTPLQRRLDHLGWVLAGAALSIVAVIFVLGLLRGEELKLMFLTAVSIAVAAVPEGLPAVVAIALAMGAQRMLRRRALIRRLLAVETLGSVTVICSDKTGTLTENRMTVAAVEAGGKRTEWARAVQARNGAAEAAISPEVTLVMWGGMLCNDASLEPSPEGEDGFRVVGDPTEGALLAAAAPLDLWKGSLEAILPRVEEAPFDSERKRMTTLHRLEAPPEGLPEALRTVWSGTGEIGGRYIAFTKGAVEGLMEVCDSVWADGGPRPLDDAWRDRIAQGNGWFAERGMRVLGVAFRTLEGRRERDPVEELERDLIFVGMVGMVDPPRPEAPRAVGTCREAGIRPVMITGDHPLTASYIARELGISSEGKTLDGRKLDRLTPEELDAAVEEVSIFARVSPLHKLRIVEALQRQGQIVAMTGDGVNDAPALRKADIGVAMGVTGTDVAKEAGEMVLLDDNFATIVAAVREGRVIYDNIRKFIKFILTCNTGELWVMLLGPLAGMPLPLLPLQILWMNLATDGLPALALSVESPERNVMERSPRSPSESVFARGVGRDILWLGLVLGLISLGVGYGFWRMGHPGWQTVLFTTLTFSQLAYALSVRAERESVFRAGLLANRFMVGALALTVLFQLGLIYVPFLQGIFRTTALSAGDLGICFALSALVFGAAELGKWIIRQRVGGEGTEGEVSE